MSFNTYVVKSILNNNEFEITEVLDLESIKSIYFNKEVYIVIEALLKNSNIEAVKALEINEIKGSEFLEIMLFKDQIKGLYAVTIYDNNELSQDPQVIDIFRLNLSK